MQIQQCDARLLSINVPDTISRQPKTLEDFKHWKGLYFRVSQNYVDYRAGQCSCIQCVGDWIFFDNNLGAQLREWLLYFSLPVLKGMLPTSQLQHYSYLVTGAHIVHSDSISEDDLILAEQCFRKFYSQHSTIYGNNLLRNHVRHSSKVFKREGKLGRMRTLYDHPVLIQKSMCACICSYNTYV